MRAALLAFALICASTAARASTTVIGDSNESQACYLAAEAGDIKRGIAHCDAALDDGLLSFQNRVASLVNRAVLLAKLRRYGPALADLNEALELSPGRPEAFANRGNIFHKKGQYRAAIADYSRAIEAGSPQLFLVYFCRGQAYEAQGRIAQAIADFKAALALNPDFADAREALTRYHALV